MQLVSRGPHPKPTPAAEGDDCFDTATYGIILTKKRMPNQPQDGKRKSVPRARGLWLFRFLVAISGETGCESPSPEAQRVPAGEVLAPSSNEAGDHSKLAEQAKAPPCTSLKGADRKLWNLADEEIPCIRDVDFSELHRPDLCRPSPNERNGGASCPEAFGVFLGKQVRSHDLRLTRDSSSPHHNGGPARLGVIHRNTWIPLFAPSREPLLCSTRRLTNATSGDGFAPCRSWTSAPVTLIFEVAHSGLRLLALPAFPPPPQCRRLGEYRGDPLSPSDVDECVFDANKLLSDRSAIPSKAYGAQVGRLLFVRKPKWDLGLPKVHPRDLFPLDPLVDVDCQPGPMVELRLRLGALAVPVLSPLQRTPITCGHQWRDQRPLTPGDLRVGTCQTDDCPPWFASLEPFVARITGAGLELVIPPKGYSLNVSQ